MQPQELQQLEQHLKMLSRAVEQLSEAQRLAKRHAQQRAIGGFPFNVLVRSANLAVQNATDWIIRAVEALVDALRIERPR
jgi:hypothetical protein